MQYVYVSVVVTTSCLSFPASLMQVQALHLQSSQVASTPELPDAGIMAWARKSCA